MLPAGVCRPVGGMKTGPTVMLASLHSLGTGMLDLASIGAEPTVGRNSDSCGREQQKITPKKAFLTVTDMGNAVSTLRTAVSETGNCDRIFRLESGSEIYWKMQSQHHGASKVPFKNYKAEEMAQ